MLFLNKPPRVLFESSIVLGWDSEPSHYSMTQVHNIFFLLSNLLREK